MTSSDIPNDIQFADDSYDNAFGDVDPDDNFFSSMYDSCNLSQQSQYYTLDRYNSVSSNFTSHLSVLCFNIRSFSANCELYFYLDLSIVYLMSRYYLKLGLVIIPLIYTRNIPEQFENSANYSHF